MVAAEQDSIIGKSSSSRRSPNKRSELLRILARVTAELVYLA